MEIIEHIENTLELDENIILEYFEQKNENEEISIDNLMNYISETGYISDYVEYEDYSYNGDELLLKEMYSEYINSKND